MRTPIVFLAAALSLASCTGVKMPPVGSDLVSSQELSVQRSAVEWALAEETEVRAVRIPRVIGLNNFQLDEVADMANSARGSDKTPSPELAAALELANGHPLRLSEAQRELLGHTALRWLWLDASEPVRWFRISRVGWSNDRQSAVVYLEIRSSGPRSGDYRATLCVLRRSQDDWQVDESATLDYFTEIIVVV